MPTSSPTSLLALARPRRRAGLLLLPLLVATAGYVAVPPSSASAQVTFGGSAQGTTGAPPAASATVSAPPTYAPPPAPGAPPVAPSPGPFAPPPPVVAAPPAPPSVGGGDSNHRERDERMHAMHETAMQRGRLAEEGSTLTGGTGLLHMQHAQGAAPGQLRVGFTAEWFSSGFLCTSDFPCANPQGGAPVTHDKLLHYGGTLSLNLGITDWLEAYGSTVAVSSSDSQNRPQLLQVLGDSNLGLKAYFSPARAFYLGLASELWLVNGTGSVGVDGSATSARFRALATVDLRELESHVPLRFSVNGGYALDNTGATLEDTELRRGAPVTRIERFGVNVNRVDHLDVSVGAEAMAADEQLRPFVEYGLLVPVNRQNYECRGNNANGDHCLASDTVVPSKLTVGLRYVPWKELSFLAAGDIGVTGVKDFIEELAPQTPWNLYLGASLTADLAGRPRTGMARHRFHPGGHVRGFVHEAGTTAPVADAIVAFDTRPELTSLATGPDGRFTTLGLPEGTWPFSVRAEGYKPATCTATLVRAPALPAAAPQVEQNPEHDAPPNPMGEVQDVQLDCPLEALPRVGRVLGHLRDETGAGVTNASIKITDAAGSMRDVTSGPGGTFEAADLPAGNTTLAAEAPGYFPNNSNLTVQPRVDNPVDLALVHRPKNPQVQVTAKEITIQQQVQFATDSATILPESNALLSEIADVLQKNPRIKKIEIQGHTDSDGGDAHNQQLSEDRANAVRTWLMQHGVAGDRLTAQGYGSKKPLVPNVTAANKARNRRVQLLILDQDPASGQTAR